MYEKHNLYYLICCVYSIRQSDKIVNVISKWMIFFSIPRAVFKGDNVYF